MNKAPEKVDRSLLLRPPPRMSIQDRLEQLEKLVVRVGTSSNVPSSNTISPGACELSSGFGRISIENSEINYVGDAHWTAILDEVCYRKLGEQHELMIIVDWGTEGFF